MNHNSNDNNENTWICSRCSTENIAVDSCQICLSMKNNEKLWICPNCSCSTNIFDKVKCGGCYFKHLYLRDSLKLDNLLRLGENKYPSRHTQQKSDFELKSQTVHDKRKTNRKKRKTFLKNKKSTNSTKMVPFQRSLQKTVISSKVTSATMPITNSHEEVEILSSITIKTSIDLNDNIYNNTSNSKDCPEENSFEMKSINSSDETNNIDFDINVGPKFHNFECSPNNVDDTILDALCENDDNLVLRSPKANISEEKLENEDEILKYASIIDCQKSIFSKQLTLMHEYNRAYNENL